MELPKVDPPPSNGGSSKKTIDSIPRDETTRKKIVDIIDHQFDIEIYLKQREVATIKQEIAKAESTLSDLKLAVENENVAAAMPEAAHYTRRSAMYYHGGSQALLSNTFYNSATSTAATSPLFATDIPKRKVYNRVPSDKSQLYGRRHDGVYVSLACPVCHRFDFANQQGFLNHCRILHNVEFGPYEQIMLRAGTPVDESEVPEEHPARLRPILDLIPIAKQKKLERPSIKVFEEDVDMELENERNNNNSADKSNSNANIPDSSSGEIKSNTETTNSADITTISTATITSDNNKETNDAKDDTKDDTKDNTKGDLKVETISVSTSASINNSTGGNSVTDTNTNSNNNVVESGSRFYIKRRIIVGNVSKFIAPERRDPNLKQFTHKWMIYLTEPPQSQQKVSDFITCVRFHLHPSYKPHDVIDVNEAPFKLTRLGWGEFPIRIQLFFVDKKRNKTVDLIHHMKLDNSHSGKQLLGSERGVEIELDRSTDFNEKSARPSESMPATPTTTTASALPSLNASSSDSPTPVNTVIKQKMSLLGGILKEGVKKLPLVRAGSHGTVLPYSCARSVPAFFKYSTGKRKALEWHRARLLRIETQNRALEANDTVLRIAAESLSTKDVVLWCVQQKYTPTKKKTATEEEEEEKVDETTVTDFGYCKFCGCVRDGHDETVDNSCPRRPKGWNVRKKNGGLNGTTSVSRLLETFEPGWEEVKDSEEDEMDVDIDMEDELKPNSMNQEEANKRKELVDRVKSVVLNSEVVEDTVDVVHERSLDWIWSVVGQLRLKSVIANDMLLAKDGNLQGPTSMFDLNAAMNQRLVVGNVLTQATKSFLKNLIEKTTTVCRKEEEGSAEKLNKMMVPYHVYQAAQKNEELDFLTNQYMGPEEEKKN